MDVNEKYLNWMECSWRRTIDLALKKAFKDIQLEDDDSITSLMSLIDGFIRNQLNISERKR